MENISPPAVSHKTRKGRQNASTASRANNNCGKPMIKVSTKEYFLDHIPPNKRRTRHGRTSDNTDNFSMRISKRNIPSSSRVLRSATQTHHEAEILPECQSCPQPCLANNQDPLTDPLHFEIGADISSSEESSTESAKACNRLPIKRVGSEHRSTYAGPPKGCYIKCDPDFNALSKENNNLTTQPNNNVTADVQQRASCNELMVEPHQRALIAKEIYRTDNLTSVSKAINPETQSQNDATQDSVFGHLLSDGSTCFDDYRWLLGFDTNDLAPELPEVTIDDIATLPNLNLDESVPVTEIRPTLFQGYANGIDSDLTAGPTSCQLNGGSQVLNSVATRAAAQPMIPQHQPLCVSTSATSSPLYVPQSQSVDTKIRNSGKLAVSTVSGGIIERISSAVKASQSSILDSNPNSTYVKKELDFQPQCRIHLVDTPPSFSRISEPDATPIRHQVFEGQNSVPSPMRNLRDRQQMAVARPQWTSAAEQSELQHLVHSVGPQINTFQDRQREPFARPQSTAGARVNERQNSVHSDGPPTNIRQDVINSQHYQAEIFQRQPLMRPNLAGEATYRPQTSACRYLVHSEEPLTVTSQNREQQSFTRQYPSSRSQRDAKNSHSYQAEHFLREQPFMLTPLPTTTTSRPQVNKRQCSVHPDEPPIRIFRSRQQQSVTRPQSTSGAQANEQQSSFHSREPPRRTFQYGAQWSTGAQPNERQNSIHFDESPMTTFHCRQQQLLARPQRTSRPHANDTFRNDQPCMRTPLPRTITCNPQANERQNLVPSGSPVCRIYPRPFARIPSTIVTPITPRVIERQNWHHSYQPQRETHSSRQDEPSPSAMAPLPDVIEFGQNLTSSKQYQHRLRTVRKRSQQVDASGRDISNQQYGSATLDADSDQHLRPHSVSGADRTRNIPSSSGARNKIISPEPNRESSGEQENFKSFTRSEVSSMMGMHAEHGQKGFSPMLPSHSLTDGDNYANTPQSSADHSSPDEQAQFGSWRHSLNVLSEYLY